MTDQSSQEPTMEEILASIRRIISEDDAPAATAAPEPTPEPEPEPEDVFEPVAEAAPVEETPAPVEDDVLELTDRYEAPPSESIGDLDVTTPEAESSTQWQPEPAPSPADDTLVGDSAAASAASAFAGLAAAVRQPAAAPAIATGSGTTIDDLVMRALEPMLKEWLDANLKGVIEADGGMVQKALRPLLKDWLDTNLPALAQAEVRKEVERIARSAG